MRNCLCRRFDFHLQGLDGVEHLARVLDSVLGPQPARQMFLGKMIGWMVKGRFLGPEPFQKNAPTGPEFVVKDDPNFAPTLARTKAQLAAFHALGREHIRNIARIQLARLEKRLAEREMTLLSTREAVNSVAIEYVNRLSDHLFVMSRKVNDNGAKDVLWVPGKNR